MRLAAGALCLLAVTVDLFRRPAAPDARVPIWICSAIAVARPALIIAGLGVVADLGLVAYAALVATALVATAVVATAVVATVTPDRPAVDAVTTWAARLLSAAGAAAAVLLIADAVYSI